MAHDCKRGSGLTPERYALSLVRWIAPSESERRRERKQTSGHRAGEGNSRIERGRSICGRHHRKRDEPHERDEVIRPNEGRLGKHVTRDIAWSILQREGPSSDQRSEHDREEAGVDDETDRAHLEARLEEAGEKRQEPEYSGAPGVEYPQHSMLEKSAYPDRERHREGEPKREMDRKSRQNREQGKGYESDQEIQRMSPFKSNAFLC